MPQSGENVNQISFIAAVAGAGGCRYELSSFSPGGREKDKPT